MASELQLVGLWPQNEGAAAIVSMNPNHQLRTPDGKTILVIRHRPGNNKPKPGSWPRSEESGELVIRDLSNNRTAIDVADASPEEAKLYNLHGQDPRQRVIPRTARDMYLIVGSDAYFQLNWNPGLVNAGVQQNLARHAALLKATGMSLSLPEEETAPAPRVYELRSRYAPTVTTRSGKSKQFHRYNTLVSGAFGTVTKVVDLSTGELWALKEIKATTYDDKWRAAFKKEVEMIAELSHPHIVYFESFQDFVIGGSFKLFFRLYEGSARQLLPPHECTTGQLPDPPPWTGRFIQQVLGALEYLHDQGVIHRDIKPDNILFDRRKENSTELDFYVADFGLGVFKDEAANSRAGTLSYMAHEVVFREEPATSAADIWSFAITLGRVLGYWCERERGLTTAEWGAKMAGLGFRGRYTEPFGSGALNGRDSQLRWYRRIMALAEGGLLPPMFIRMLLQHPHRATAPDCLGVPVQNFVERVAPQPLERYSHGTVHIPAQRDYEMSIDVPRMY